MLEIPITEERADRTMIFPTYVELVRKSNYFLLIIIIIKNFLDQASSIYWCPKVPDISRPTRRRQEDEVDYGNY